MRQTVNPFTYSQIERGMLGEYLIYIDSTCVAVAKNPDQAKDSEATAVHAFNWAYESGTRNDIHLAIKYAWWFMLKYVDDPEFWSNRSHATSFWMNFMSDPNGGAN